MPAAREFNRLLAAEGISNFGAILSRLAIPWLAALVLDATPLQMAALLVADVAAAAVGSLLLGAWVERSGKRAVMLLTDALRCLVLAALAVLAWRGAATMTLLACAAAANGVLTMAFEVARSAWMAQRLAAEELVHRNAQMAMVSSLSETAAFALGGWLFQWLGAALALIVDALSYAASALCLRAVREVTPAAGAAAAIAATARADDAPVPGQRAAGPVAGGASLRASVRAACRNAWQQLTAGLAVVAARGRLRALAVIEGGLAFAGSVTGTAYMIYVARDLAIPTGHLGIIFALGGLGAVLGARVAAVSARRWGTGTAMAAGLAAAALGAACIPLAGSAGVGAGASASASLAGAIILLVAHQIIGDAGHTLYAVHDRTLRQTAVDVSLLARADAALRFVGQCATLAGAGLGGIVGSAFGARGALAASAAWLALLALYAAAMAPRFQLAPAPAAVADEDSAGRPT
jgi:Na+/melibiose symporter-like transporter